MNKIEQIADAILYEGYNLYPFRKSSLKNRKRFNFGIISPKHWAETRSNESFFQQTEVLISSNHSKFVFLLRARFLQIENKENDWQSVCPRIVEKQFDNAQALNNEINHCFKFGEEKNFCQINGRIKVSSRQITKNLYKLTIILLNETKVSDYNQEQVLPISFISTHSILDVENARFISLLETPKKFEKYRKNCENIGVFPVLVGNKKKTDAILSSPIILYDFPEVAEDSFDNFFDGTEIDELMVLSLLALTDEEKIEIRKTDQKAAKILDRLELADNKELLKLHSQMNRR